MITCTPSLVKVISFVFHLHPRCIWCCISVQLLIVKYADDGHEICWRWLHVFYDFRDSHASLRKYTFEGCVLTVTPGVRYQHVYNTIS